MAKLKYICLSDLHLGAGYSILTHLDPDGKPAPQQPSEALTTFGVALRQLVSELRDAGEPEPPPTLLLLGDILDLGQSPVGQTTMGFQRFVEALWPKQDSTPLFSPTVYYVPGNHDHSLWQAAKERHYVEQLTTTDEQEPSPITPAFTPPTLECLLLTKLLGLSTSLSDASVRLAYPNFGEISRDGTRCVVFHHGHFIESLYRLMSDVRWLVESHPSTPTTVAELERQNATWIDFVWSTFGETGKVGQDVVDLYTILQDNAATNRMLSRLSEQIVRRLRPYLPMSGEAEVLHYARLVIKVVLDLLGERWAEAERHSYLSVLSDASVAGLRWYLDGPLAQQIKSERQGQMPEDVTFIFGHTHKPFEDYMPLVNYPEPVKIFNTGGWVLDEPKMVPLEGAAVVFVDDELNIVSLRLYNDPLNQIEPTVHIPTSGAYPAKTNALCTAVQAALQRYPEQWQAFTDAVARALEERQRLLIDGLTSCQEEIL